MALLLITTFVHIPDAALAITTFNASTGGSASFSGDSTKFLQVTNETTTSLNMAEGNDFTISWWQKSIVTQTLYPRILQFGHGHDYQDKFAISEEPVGEWPKIILWINGMMITSTLNPNPGSDSWHHIAITRNGNDFSWFIDGVFLYSDNNEVENFNTSNLDLLIGSGDDQGTGGFSGNLAGVQISKSVRWETATVFTPPIDFQNPGSGLAFSMYVSQSAVIDKSGNNLVVLPKPIGMGGPTDFIEFLDDFNPPNLTPTPTAPDSPTSVSATDGEDASTTVSWTAPVSDGGSAITEYNATTESGQTCTSNVTECRITGLTNGSAYTFTVTASNEIGTSAPSSASASITPTSPIPIDWSLYPSKFRVDDPGQNESDWGQELRVYKDESADESAPDFDFNRIKHVSIGVPVTYSGSTDIKCYLKVPDPDPPVTDDNERAVGLWKFQDFISAFNNPTFSNCDGSEIPDYQYGMFGETQTTVSVYLWTQETVTDFSEIESAFEELHINLNLPSHISIQSITRGDNVETDPGRISFGDTITVTVENESATAYMAMLFALPESGNAANICRYYLVTIDGSDIYGRTFPLPTLDDLLSYCREQYEGDWEFDIEAERSFSIVAFDGGENYSVASDSQLILNPIINWSLYPSRVSVSYPTWNKIYTFSKDDNAPHFDFDRISDITIGLPVTYVAINEALVDTICYLRVDGEDLYLVEDSLRLQLFGFGSVLNRLPDCISASDAGHPNGWFDRIVSIGIFGESHTTISVHLWADGENDFEFPEKAFEVVNINVNLPPLILGHTITRTNNSETDEYKIHSGDIVHFSFVNSSLEIENMDFIVEVPEAHYAGQLPSELGDYLCWVNIEPNLAGVFGESVTVPSAAQISTQCHLEYDGGWIFDESITRSILIGVDDTQGNSIPSYLALTLAAQTQAPEPDRTAPPTAEPTPPKKTILEQPAPPAPTPEPPAPTPISTPSAPTPDPIVITPEPIVVTPEPIVVTPEPIVITPEPVVAEVLVKSELPVAEKPIKIALVAKACVKAGVWIFTKNNLLQICDTKLKPVLVIPACTGKKATPTYPWLFKAQRFKPGYSSTQSGQKLYYSVFFFKGLAIAGVDKVSPAPCSNGSVFIEKKYAKQVYTYIAKNKSLIWVKS